MNENFDIWERYSCMLPKDFSRFLYDKGGIAITDEDGYEAKLREIREGRYTLLQESDMIFSAEDTNKLWEIVNNPSSFFASHVDNMLKQTMAPINSIQNNDNKSIVNNFDFGGVVVEHPVDADDLVGSLVQKASSRSDVTKNMRGN